MTDEKEQRKDAYTRGYEMALENALAVLDVGIDFYPTKPSTQVLGRLMKGGAGNAQQFLDLLGEFKKKIMADVKKKNGEGPAAAA